MMRYSRGELARNARLLHIVAMVVVFVYLLAGLGAGLSAAGVVLSRGFGGGLALAAFVVVFLVTGTLAALLVAPLRLLVEAALCLAQIEENTRAAAPIEERPGERAA